MMNGMDFGKSLNNARTLPDIFELVKDAVRKSMKRGRAGLMLGIADLGNHPQGFLGAFFPLGSNIIVMNRVPMERIKETEPDLYKPYVFHVLLHEYIHTLGFVDEGLVRRLAYKVTEEVFDKDHHATLIAEDTRKYFKNLVYPNSAWEPKDLRIELVHGFDRSSTSYIA